MTALRTPLFVLAILSVTIIAACSSEPEPDTSLDSKSLAEQMITDDLAGAIGLGPLVPLCNNPGPLAVGTTFACTATTEPGLVIQVQGTVNPEGRLQLTTTNLVGGRALPSFERQAAGVLNNSVGSNFTAESVDCGDNAAVLASDFVLGCALMMPASGEVFDLTLTITDLDARRFSLAVGDQPRS